MADDVGEGQAHGRPEAARHVAKTLGCKSENAFNTTLRRVVGCAPRRYARAQL
ncbi:MULTISPECIES: hypothetical protein [Rhodopseudomonas]|uniref:hypothetical protein n=1 Tax=Rhodopseudomonas TaxID=1073 RepID=UPI000ACF87B0|nr:MULTISPECIES: hypothetical protein [Rhodopseudomonas]MDF3812891.1 hypothetical protein [Rhodopseudomonas sp. BAL398]